MTVQYNAAQMTVIGVPGTDAVTLGVANSNYQTFARAGAQSGDILVVRFQTGTSFEVSECTYSSSGPTLTRNTVLDSTTGSVISLASDTVCSIVNTKRDNPDPVFHTHMGAP